MLEVNLSHLEHELVFTALGHLINRRSKQLNELACSPDGLAERELLEEELEVMRQLRIRMREQRIAEEQSHA